MKVEVLVADLEGGLPAGLKLGMVGGMLMAAATKAGRGQESVTPLKHQGVTAVLVKADLAERERVANLILFGGEQLNLGEDDELVMQQPLVEALHLEELMGVSSRAGTKLVADPQPVFEMFRLRAA